MSSVGDELRERVDKKFAKVARQVSSLADMEVELIEERNPSIRDKQIAEVTLHLKGVTLRAREASEDMVHSINLAAEDLARQVKRHRDKRRKRREAHQASPGRRASRTAGASDAAARRGASPGSAGSCRPAGARREVASPPGGVPCDLAARAVAQPAKASERPRSPGERAVRGGGTLCPQGGRKAPNPLRLPRAFGHFAARTGVKAPPAREPSQASKRYATAWQLTRRRIVVSFPLSARRARRGLARRDAASPANDHGSPGHCYSRSYAAFRPRPPHGRGQEVQAVREARGADR